MTVLGISANSRLLAMAMVKNNDLLDFTLHFFREKWSDHKMRKIIAYLKPCIQLYSITNVALTIPYEHYQNKETKKLITEIITYCQKNNCTVTTYDPEAFHFFFQETSAKKKALMESMVNRYPELLFPYRKELRNKRRYYHKLFEAVAAGTLLARDLSLRNTS